MLVNSDKNVINQYIYQLKTLDGFRHNGNFTSMVIYCIYGEINRVQLTHVPQ